MSDLAWMKQAYLLAEKAKTLGEVPVGAVLVDNKNQLVASAHNAVISDNDPTAHAEILVLRRAAEATKNYRLSNTTLYVTLEPCAMCAGAIVHARVHRLVFATRDLRAGSAGSVCNLLKGLPWNHRVQIDEGILETECSQLLRHFFREQR